MRRNSIVAAALVVACNCESAQTPPAPASPASRDQKLAAEAMLFQHALEAAKLQESIALGRLVDARERAAALATRTADTSIRDAAQTVARGGDVPAMASALGSLGRAYAAYHEAQRAPIALPPAPPPPDADDVQARMQRHQWAAARLWEGLIGADAERWQSGARVLVTLDIEVSRLMHEKPNVEVIEYAERMRDQAQHALTVDSTEGRAQLYGEMLQTCASCHSIVRPVPVVTEVRR